MRICDKCMAEVGPDRKHCPECGAPLDDSFEAVEHADREVYPVLARANLLRMRGEVQQAEKACLEILRRYPNHATANALMGEILLDQGKEEDARQWFLSTLEIDPSNTQARARLEHLARRTTPAASNAPPETGGRVGPWMWGLFLLVAATVAAAGFIAGRRMAEAPAEPDPDFVQRRLEYQSPPRAQQSAREAEVLRRIGATDSVVASRVAGLSFDPRTSETTLTLMADPPLTRGSVASLAVKAAAAVFQSDESTLSVRVLVLGPVNEQTETLLTADVRRAALQLPANPSEADLIRVLERPWWHSSLQPTTPPQTVPPDTPPPIPDPTGPPDRSTEGLPPGPPETRTGPPPQ